MRQQGSEKDLIVRMQAGDGTAVEELSTTYGPRIHQLAFRYLKNWEDAEEVTQDVLLKVHRKIDAFRGDAALSSWIYRITFNTAMSRLRTSRFARPLEVQAPEPSGENWRPHAARAGRLVGACRRWRAARADEGAAGRRAPASAGGLPGSGDPARHPGAFHGRSQRRPARQAADLEVASASRPSDSARAHGAILPARSRSTNAK